MRRIAATAALVIAAALIPAAPATADPRTATGVDIRIDPTGKLDTRTGEVRLDFKVRCQPFEGGRNLLTEYTLSQSHTAGVGGLGARVVCDGRWHTYTTYTSPGVFGPTMPPFTRGPGYVSIDVILTNDEEDRTGHAERAIRIV